MNRKHDRLILLCLATLFGFLLSLQIKTINSSSLVRGETEELEKAVLSYMRKNDELAERNQELSHYVEQLEQDLASGNTNQERILKEKERAAIFAGLRTVHNSGLSVHLNPQGNAKMQEVLLWEFCNELSALGAQALSVNGQRKVAMSEIRETNENMVINGLPFKRQEPFIIQAILDPGKLDYALSVLEIIKKQMLEQYPEQFQITCQKENDVLIEALSENSGAYRTDLLTPVTK